ncbi:MAG: ATP-binding protein, partial [Fusobacteriota bacterium]
MDLNEIVVISGKGGTGKTTLVTSMIPFFEDLVIGDCDVDAPDLDIIFDKTLEDEREFVGTQKAVIDEDKCINCGRCHESCNFNAITSDIEMKTHKCEGCGVCEYVCPVDAITMVDGVVGKIFTSKTDYGKMVHARLIPGEETSGKLVSEVRKVAKNIAESEGKTNMLVDGSPGMACNVISSMTGAKKVVIVTEPTLSGLHDLKRVYDVTQKFRLPVTVVINKHDISKNMT